jgi:hypothetical protein
MERSPTFLMANLGSEVSQVFMYVERDNLEMARNSAERANKIIDELINHPELIGRTEEVEMVNKIISDLFSKERQLEVEQDEMEDYFMPFALRALSENKIISD